MRILYDSKQTCYKTPFGTLLPEQTCTLHIHVPRTVGALRVDCCLRRDDGQWEQAVPMLPDETRGDYEIFSGSFALPAEGLYFYDFRIYKPHDSFRLLKTGNQTNMEDGDLWQVSCIPKAFTTPDWAKGAVIYQIFPDRFCKCGDCDLRDKLQPYTIHADWQEEVRWQPTAQGLVLNNDFYGGNFRGITQKLDYLASMGVTIVYLNPIHKSFSNHRYDAGDYKTPDPMLGTEQDFSSLCEAAHRRGIRVILDGVFSHTGSNSLYFNKNGTFPGKGAYQSPDSPYYSWYTFRSYPEEYQSWWNFDTLPTVQKMNPSFIEYIITGENSVVAHWLGLGADGFRLDVVDELPDAFTLLLKQRIRQLKPDALLMGEVWEDASNKIAYGVRRRYFVDGVLDSVMNYPFRTAILNFVRQWDDGSALADTVMTLAENYPPQVLACNMNLLGSHDTARILTALVDDFDGSREEKARRRMTQARYQQAKQLLLMASFLQYMLPGAPSLYYGDEAGMEGYQDPFNRRPYPWGKEDAQLVEHFRRLGDLRKRASCLRTGTIAFCRARDGRLEFVRKDGKQALRICINHTEESWPIPAGRLLYGHRMETVAQDHLCLGPMGMCVTEE